MIRAEGRMMNKTPKYDWVADIRRGAAAAREQAAALLKLAQEREQLAAQYEEEDKQP